MAFDPISAVADVVGKVIDRVLPDKEKQAAAQLELEKLRQSGELQAIAGQLAINQTEAQSKSLLVSGWRPSVGWVCCAGLSIQFVIRPLFTWVAGLIGHPVEFPSLDMGTMLELLAGMLGLSGMRTFEKTQGVAAK